MKNISGGQMWSLALLVVNKETESEDLGVRGLALILPHSAGDPCSERYLGYVQIWWS